MKIIKKIIILSFVLSIILNIQYVFAKEIKHITNTTTIANVVKVIDGDTIKVKLSNGDLAYVKLKGITSNGFDDSFKYLTDTLLGEDVTLIKNGISYVGGTFNYLTVISNEININNEMLKNGLAVIDKNQEDSVLAKKLASYEQAAKNSHLGIWRVDSSNYSTITGDNIPYTPTVTNRVNINTATIYQLERLLKDVSRDVAINIVNYREKNPFSTVSEIKFVKGFSKSLYDKNKDLLTVSTNINTASEFELKTLYEITDIEVKRILEQRNIKKFEYISDIRNLISYSTYNKISSYISTFDVYNVNSIIPYKRANISLSDRTYLTSASVSSSLADDIIKYRKNGYTYKTLMELTKISNLTEQDVNYLADNLEVFTNVNTNDIDNLIPVFGRTNSQKLIDRKIYQIYEIKNIIGDKEFNRVKNAICIDTNKDEYVNINTASKEQMYSQGISVAQASDFIKKRPIKNASQLPFDISSINNKISLYTNINTASKKEILSLSLDITNTIADNIIRYREQEPFASLDEIREFFKTNNALSTYDKIKDYIVVR